LNYASTGVGTVPHLSGELFAVRTGAKMLHVPYKGSPEAATDLLAGRVAMIFSPASAVVANAKEGKLKLLATGTGVRLGILPDVPTMVEAGVPDFETAIWFGLVAPAGTPRPIVDKLAKAVGEATAAPEVAKAWEPQGILPLKGGPDDLARFIVSETRRWGEAATAAGLKK
jgi:tripartite-type tricarboxylate transporter receptor subunit TctC